MKIYLAGPLFMDSEVRQRRFEAKRLRELGYEVYSPIEANDDIGFDPERLYRLDIEAMENADICVLCLDNMDSGTIAELGWMVAKGKPVFSTFSSWKFEDPVNIFVRGLAKDGENKIFKSLDLLFDYLMDYNKDVQ
jgi:nucleoside 2-deoxyribosyltransferase